jgi:hypothetical protein
VAYRAWRRVLPHSRKEELDGPGLEMLLGIMLGKALRLQSGSEKRTKSRREVFLIDINIY